MTFYFYDIETSGIDPQAQLGSGFEGYYLARRESDV